MPRTLPHRNARDRRGFTLIELLVVVVIIGVLAAIAVPVYLTQEGKGHDAALKSDMLAAASELASYATDNPTATAPPTQSTLTGYGLTISTGDTLTVTGSAGSGWCIQGNNITGTAPSGTNSFWYDSTTGSPPVASKTPPGADATAACYPANVSAASAQQYIGPTPGGGGGASSSSSSTPPSGAIAEPVEIWPSTWAEDPGPPPAWSTAGVMIQPWDTTATDYYNVYAQINGGAVVQGFTESEGDASAASGGAPPFQEPVGPSSKFPPMSSGGYDTVQVAVYSGAAGKPLLSYSMLMQISCQPTAAWLTAHPTATLRDSQHTYNYTWADGTKCYVAYENGQIAPNTD